MVAVSKVHLDLLNLSPQKHRNVGPQACKSDGIHVDTSTKRIDTIYFPEIERWHKEELPDVHFIEHLQG